MALMDYQVYPEDYFSGSDVSIYFGDTWIDEIVSINFMVMEYLEPLYGYNSYVYDACARGSRIVQGNLRINFKESYYLHKIIEDIKFIQDQADTWANAYGFERQEADDVVLNSIVDKIKLRDKLKDLSTDQMWKLAKKIQQQAWDKKKNVSPSSRQPYFKQADSGFDIIISYGSRLKENGTLGEANRKYGVPPATVYTISGVQLSSTSHVITSDGAPVYEDFQFIAKDLDHGQSQSYDSVIDTYNK
jgi:hypothetical protein